MKRILTVVLCTLLTCSAMGQGAFSSEKPDWVDGYFKELTNSYLEVVSAYGYDLESAREKATSQAIARRSMATGTEAKVQRINGEMVVSSSHGVIVKARVVDEYIVHTASGYTVYMLVQTAKNPSLPYDNVSVTDRYGFSARALVPGMAQFHKGDVLKGSLFLGGEVLLVGGVLTTHFLSVDFANKAQGTHDASLKKTYLNNANGLLIARNVTIGAVAALYIWNIVDACAAKGKRHVAIGGKPIAIVPYSDFRSTGLQLTMNF